MAYKRLLTPSITVPGASVQKGACKPEGKLSISGLACKHVRAHKYINNFKIQN